MPKNKFFSLVLIGTLCQPSMLDLKAWGVAAWMASAGASFHKRMAAGENEALGMFVLRDGTRNFWSFPLIWRDVGVNHGRSGVTSTWPLMILFNIVVFTTLCRFISGSSFSRETSWEALVVGRKSYSILLAEQRWTISRPSTAEKGPRLESIQVLV